MQIVAANRKKKEGMIWVTVWVAEPPSVAEEILWPKWWFDYSQTPANESGQTIPLAKGALGVAFHSCGLGSGSTTLKLAIEGG